MREPVLRGAGAAVSLLVAAIIGWMSTAQPRSMTEVAGGLAATIGAYRIDAVAFEDGLRFFHDDQFVSARAAFQRADPAARDAVTQFYIAYSYYRQGWSRFGRDDALYAEGLTVVDRAIAAAEGGRVVVDDPRLGMHSADELRAELVAGQTREWSDLNPLRVLEQRK